MPLIPSPRSVYIHAPFCRRRCGYCNFTVVAGRDDLIEPYLRALERELSWQGRPRPVETLYVGGGTPSHLAPAAQERMLRLVSEWFPPEREYEWTLEANPLDLDEARLATAVGAGVNRLSLGVQSFDAGKLQLLERDHRSAEIERAYAAARAVIPNISLDLIFGAPGETREGWRRDLERAIAVGPDHLSLYGLTFERGARFWGRLLRKELTPVGEALERAMYEDAIDMLAAHGYEHYEVSNFARPGRRSRHNEACWLGKGYWAAGPGAARFVGDVRETNHRGTTTYLRRVLSGRSPVAEREQLSAEQLARDRLIFGLRRLEGIDHGAFEETTGFTLERLAGESLRRFADWGLIQRTSTNTRLTRQGLMVSDSLWPDLL